MFETIAQNIPDQQISFHDITLIIRRLDLVHPQISGNKFFKLKYNFLEAKRQGYQHILSFGGAYSNHIAATAFAAQQFGFQSVGVIRGEELADRPLNPTLATAQQFGMQLHFVSRDEYRRKQRPEYLAELARHFPEHYVIPEGGTNALAIRGCQEILKENAKTSAALMQFIRDFEAEFSIPLEQIYTAKMLMGIFDLIEKNYFPAGSKLLVIHSGGLQGRNISFDSITT